jgi:hypothetical protein
MVWENARVKKVAGGACVPHMSGGQVNTDNHIKIMINFVHLTESIDVGSRNHIRLNHVIMSESGSCLICLVVP